FTTGTSCDPNIDLGSISGMDNVSAPISFESNSSAQRLCIKATDNNDNVIVETCDTESFLVDTSVPTAGINVVTSGISVTMNADFTDNQSGMWKYVYYYDDNILCSETTSTSCSGDLDVGNYILKIVGYNNAGLTATASQDV